MQSIFIGNQKRKPVTFFRAQQQKLLLTDICEDSLTHYKNFRNEKWNNAGEQWQENKSTEGRSGCRLTNNRAQLESNIEIRKKEGSFCVWGRHSSAQKMTETKEKSSE